MVIRRTVTLRWAILVPASALVLQTLFTKNAAASDLPTLQLPDPKIAEVYRGNWENSLQPALVPPPPPGTAPANPNEEPHRPWKVDVDGHYPGWYPGVDVKHMAAAYLACAKDLDSVLRAWDLTAGAYLLKDGSVRPMTFYNNPHSVVPEATADNANVYYPLRLTANIDFLLLGDMIFRFSQDQGWLSTHLPTMRKAADWMEGWIDPEGLIHSDSYDLDQVFREIDGVANASAILAFRRLADLEAVAENPTGRDHYTAVANRIAAAMEKHFWNPALGFYNEHLIYNNVASERNGGHVMAASSELDTDHAAAKALDGIRGTGIDAFNVGIGAAGKHEWAAKGETAGAWIQVGLKEPTRIGAAILFNRTDPAAQPGERIARGYLEFSDASPRIEVTFNTQDISRAVVAFEPREVAWVKFTGATMQGEGGANAGLAEIMLLSADTPYIRVNHGMTDTNFAVLGFGISPPERAKSVWDYFQAHEAAFYEVDGLRAPTWIAEKAESYTPADLNKRAPYKDCVAMARIWRYDALMRQRMRDGEGIYRTITYANTLYDRPSGGGAGFFAERYGLGRFQPGDEAQYTVAKYTEYPAVYNSFIAQQTLLGVDVDVRGTITIDPCVPADWYKQGFGAEGLGVMKDRDVGFLYHEDRIEGWVSGAPGDQKLRLRLPPALAGKPLTVRAGDTRIANDYDGDMVTFDVPIPSGDTVPFRIEAKSD